MEREKIAFVRKKGTKVPYDLDVLPCLGFAFHGILPSTYPKHVVHK